MLEPYGSWNSDDVVRNSKKKNPATTQANKYSGTNTLSEKISSLTRLLQDGDSF